MPQSDETAYLQGIKYVKCFTYINKRDEYI